MSCCTSVGGVWALAIRRHIRLLHCNQLFRCKRAAHGTRSRRAGSPRGLAACLIAFFSAAGADIAHAQRHGLHGADLPMQVEFAEGVLVLTEAAKALPPDDADGTNPPDLVGSLAF